MSKNQSVCKSGGEQSVECVLEEMGESYITGVLGCTLTATAVELRLESRVQT
jgi:hypothetical protein